MRFVVWCLLCVPLLAVAGEILDSSANLDAGVFTLALTARIDAPPATVQRLITDYDRLTEINSSLTESRVVLEHSPLKHRVHTVIRACILFFCRSVTQVQDITRDPNGRIEAVILPALSDFRQGYARWDLAAAGNGTTMHFSATLEPSFWVPPLIGPWLFERQLITEVRESSAIMEARAREAGAR
ncbi:MAG: SRPBCC family protein [Gammaproteobacteria bacterium]|nr:SRPBCC family protein [Gammaproteobacteria bacterium]